MPGNMRHPRGVVSLLALIIVTTVTATAVGSAAIIINELRQTQSLDQAIIAVYAAEAGLEDSLAIVKYQRDHNERLDETVELLSCSPLDGDYPSCVNSRQSILAGASTANWYRAASNEDRFLVPELASDKTAHLDIFNPDESDLGSGIESLRIEWADECPGHSTNGFSWLEITMLTWEGAVIQFDPSTQHVYKLAQPCNITENRCEDIVLNDVNGGDIEPDQVYRFSFRALSPVPGDGGRSCSVKNLSVTAYAEPDAPSEGTVVELPARITVKSTGLYGRSQQALSASIPWRAPVSGLLNFVLFSEDEIEK